MRRTHRYVGFILTILLVLAVTIPPFHELKGHTHWGKVVWVPFADKRLAPWELALNVLLFVPFGLAGPWRRAAGPRRLLIAAVAGAALSLLVEAVQVYSHARLPTATDVLANTLGAVIGAARLPGEAGRSRA